MFHYKLKPKFKPYFEDLLYHFDWWSSTFISPDFTRSAKHLKGIFLKQEICSYNILPLNLQYIIRPAIHSKFYLKLSEFLYVFFSHEDFLLKNTDFISTDFMLDQSGRSAGTTKIATTYLCVILLSIYVMDLKKHFYYFENLPIHLKPYLFEFVPS